MLKGQRHSYYARNIAVFQTVHSKFGKSFSILFIHAKTLSAIDNLDKHRENAFKMLRTALAQSPNFIPSNGKHNFKNLVMPVRQ